MMGMTAKISFELTKDGAITIEVRGNASAVKAGLLSIVERIADTEEVSMKDYLDEMKAAATFSEMAKDPDILFSEILNNLLEEDDANYEMSEEMKELFDKMFGRLN